MNLKSDLIINDPFISKIDQFIFWISGKYFANDCNQFVYMIILSIGPLT